MSLTLELVFYGFSAEPPGGRYNVLFYDEEDYCQHSCNDEHKTLAEAEACAFEYLEVLPLYIAFIDYHYPTVWDSEERTPIAYSEYMDEDDYKTQP